MGRCDFAAGVPGMARLASWLPTMAGSGGHLTWPSLAFKNRVRNRPCYSPSLPSRARAGTRFRFHESVLLNKAGLVVRRFDDWTVALWRESPGMYSPALTFADAI